jgi:hypothetical protein
LSTDGEYVALLEVYWKREERKDGRNVGSNG